MHFSVAELNIWFCTDFRRNTLRFQFKISPVLRQIWWNRRNYSFTEHLTDIKIQKHIKGPCSRGQLISTKRSDFVEKLSKAPYFPYFWSSRSIFIIYPSCHARSSSYSCTIDRENSTTYLQCRKQQNNIEIYHTSPHVSTLTHSVCTCLPSYYIYKTPAFLAIQKTAPRLKPWGGHLFR